MTNGLPRSISVSSPPHAAVVCGAYYVTLLAYLLGAFFPEHRIWAFNNWAYFSRWVPMCLFAVGAVMPLVALYAKRYLIDLDQGDKNPRQLGKASWYSLVITLALSVALFYAVRPDTFFLGDGYTVVSLLARDAPLVKLRVLGESLLHIGVKNLLGFSGESGALSVFQIVSISAGVGFVATIIRFAAILYRVRSERILFTLFMVSVGPMLLFFGYVENYSIFVLSIAVYALYGLLVAQGRGRWYLLLPLAAVSCFLHVFGVVLIPSLVYLICSATPLRSRLNALSPMLKVVSAGTVSVLGILIFAHFYSNNLGFRFAIVPLLPDRFTVEGYWLLSPNHLIDLVNLLFLLLPSAAVAAVCLLGKRSRDRWRHRDYRYLLILCLSAAGAAFLFDPKMGMARDWDLFAFGGIPLAVAAAYALLDRRYFRPRNGPAAIMAIALGLLVLMPRVIGQATAGIAIARFNNYASLDRTKNMYGRTLLVKYYQSQRDGQSVAREAERYRKDYPERVINHQGVNLKDQEDCPQAMVYFRRALELNPVFSAAYTNIGMCLQELGNLDSALHLFGIAAALNPYNPTIAVKLAGAHLAAGDYDEAERSLNWAVRIDPENLDAHLGLLQVYKALGRRDERLSLLKRLTILPGVPPEVTEELVEGYVQLGALDDAAATLRTAADHGLDSSAVARILQGHPELELIYRAAPR